MKIATITNQSWDLTNRYGYLVASSNNYLAYVLEGMVTMTIVTIIITLFCLFSGYILYFCLFYTYSVCIHVYTCVFV